MNFIDYSTALGKDYYIDLPISKDKWLETDLTLTMAQTIRLQFNSSRLLYSFPIRDSELQVIEVTLNYPAKDQGPFSDIIHRAIPYPVLLIQNYHNEQFKVSSVYAHINQTNHYRKVVDDRHSTAWIDKRQLMLLLNEIDTSKIFGSDNQSVQYYLSSILYSFNRDNKFTNKYGADLTRRRKKLNNLRSEYWKMSNETHSYTGRKFSNVLQQIEMFVDCDIDLFSDDDYFDDDIEETSAKLSEFYEEIKAYNGEDIYDLENLYELNSEFLESLSFFEETNECLKDMIYNRKAW